MKILVLLRMSPDPDGALELKADGSGLDREWMDLKLNEFDDHALEEAVLLKEATAGSVIAVAIGEGAQRTLQMAIARGATSAIAIEWPEEEMILTPAIAPTVAGLARDHGVDLVMTGVQTSEDILGQAAPFIGGLLGWPHVSGTSRVVSEGPGKLVVAQERGGGVRRQLSYHDARRPWRADREQPAALRVRHKAPGSRSGADRVRSSRRSRPDASDRRAGADQGRLGRDARRFTEARPPRRSSAF